MIRYLAAARAWLRQPTTVMGLAGLVGTASSYLSGAAPLSVAVPSAAASLVAMALPDNTAAASDAKALAADLVKAVADTAPTKPKS